MNKIGSLSSFNFTRQSDYRRKEPVYSSVRFEANHDKVSTKNSNKKLFPLVLMGLATMFAPSIF